ncbi:hypothetical protein D3C80_1246040 [compost metagenome]
MLLDQPDDRFGLLAGEAETLAKLAGHTGAGNRMVFLPALGDIVQQHGDIKRLALFNAGHQLVGERMGINRRALVHFRQHADGADQMLIHRIVMIHVELHHRDDLAEFGNELAQHPRLVHAAQSECRITPRGEDRQEQPVRFLVFAKLVIDERQRAGDDTQSIRMQFKIVDIGDVEETDQIDRVVLEDVRLGQSDPSPVLNELH